MSDAYVPLLDALAADSEPIVAAVVADVALPGDDPVAVAALVRPAVEGLIAGLGRGPALPGADLGRLHREGAAAARSGEGVAAPIDRYLSSGWAIWDVATRHPSADPAALAALGAALLRAGDAAAAAIAEGHGEAEREMAARTASARRALVDDLLDLVPGDSEAIARLTRRAIGLGIDHGAACTVVVAWLGRELEDVGPEAARIERALARPVRHPSARSSPPPMIAARRGRLVLVTSEGVAQTTLHRLLADLADGGGWAAVSGGAAQGLASVAGIVADALAALRIVERIGPAVTVVDAADMALGRAMLADPARLDAAVERELGPLLRAPRAGRELVATIAAYVANRQNVRATARALGLAPRTVTYRLRRIETLLGRRLDGPTIRRLLTALMALDLLEATSQGRGRSADRLQPTTGG